MTLPKPRHPCGRLTLCRPSSHPFGPLQRDGGLHKSARRPRDRAPRPERGEHDDRDDEAGRHHRTGGDEARAAPRLDDAPHRQGPRAGADGGGVAARERAAVRRVLLLAVRAHQGDGRGDGAAERQLARRPDDPRARPGGAGRRRRREAQPRRGGGVPHEEEPDVLAADRRREHGRRRRPRAPLPRDAVGVLGGAARRRRLPLPHDPRVPHPARGDPRGGVLGAAPRVDAQLRDLVVLAPRPRRRARALAGVERPPHRRAARRHRRDRRAPGAAQDVLERRAAPADRDDPAGRQQRRQRPRRRRRRRPPRRL